MLVLKAAPHYALSDKSQMMKRVLCHLTFLIYADIISEEKQEVSVWIMMRS